MNSGADDNNRNKNRGNQQTLSNYCAAGLCVSHLRALLNFIPTLLCGRASLTITLSHPDYHPYQVSKQRLREVKQLARNQRARGRL